MANTSSVGDILNEIEWPLGIGTVSFYSTRCIVEPCLLEGKVLDI